MDKRLAKRHKRQVERAKEKVKVSEPDVRTPEQIEAAREASRPDLSRGNSPKIADTGPSFATASRPPPVAAQRPTVSHPCYFPGTARIAGRLNFAESARAM